MRVDKSSITLHAETNSTEFIAELEKKNAALEKKNAGLEKMNAALLVAKNGNTRIVPSFDVSAVGHATRGCLGNTCFDDGWTPGGTEAYELAYSTIGTSSAYSWGYSAGQADGFIEGSAWGTHVCQNGL